MRNYLALAILFFAAFFITASTSRNANAACLGCNLADCAAGGAVIVGFHKTGKIATTQLMANRFIVHRDFITRHKFMNRIVNAMAKMTNQLSATGMGQIMSIGQFFDAKAHLERERLFATLKAEAVRDYQPNEGFCAIGTNTRALYASDMKRRLNNSALDVLGLKRQMGARSMGSADGAGMDMALRFETFRTTTCDANDNNITGGGLAQACGDNAGRDPKRTNRDVDYGGFIDNARTLEMDFLDANTSADEQDFIALTQNIFGHKPLSVVSPGSSDANAQYFIRLRSVAARRALAQHSLNAIAAMKSSGSSAPGETNGDQTYAYLGAVLRDLGVSDSEIYKMIGDKPSLYAQLEILAKKMLQSPNFYTHLVDKPANIERKKAALNAIELMVDRALAESETRQEMVMSVLLATKLGDDINVVKAQLE